MGLFSHLYSGYDKYTFFSNLGGLRQLPLVLLSCGGECIMGLIRHDFSRSVWEISLGGGAYLLEQNQKPGGLEYHAYVIYSSVNLFNELCRFLWPNRPRCLFSFLLKASLSAVWVLYTCNYQACMKFPSLFTCQHKLLNLIW